MKPTVCLTYLVVCAWASSDPEIAFSMTHLFAACAISGALGGIGALLRCEKEALTIRGVLSHALNMACFGAALSMVMFWAMEPSTKTFALIIGIAGMAGLVGLPMIEFGGDVVRKRVRAILGASDEKD